MRLLKFRSYFTVLVKKNGTSQRPPVVVVVVINRLKKNQESSSPFLSLLLLPYFFSLFEKEKTVIVSGSKRKEREREEEKIISNPSSFFFFGEVTRRGQYNRRGEREEGERKVFFFVCVPPERPLFLPVAKVAGPWDCLMIFSFLLLLDLKVFCNLHLLTLHFLFANDFFCKPDHFASIYCRLIPFLSLFSHFSLYLNQSNEKNDIFFLFPWFV